MINYVALIEKPEEKYILTIERNITGALYYAQKVDANNNPEGIKFLVEKSSIKLFEEKDNATNAIKK